MSVPLALLGLLEREPSYGYDLKRDYDAYFGRGKPLSFGQVYATLARLSRDGKASAGEVEPGAGPDRKRYRITEAGKYEVEEWLAEPTPAEPHLQTDLFVKVVLSHARSSSGRVPRLTARRALAEDARAHRAEAAGQPRRRAPRRSWALPSSVRRQRCEGRASL